MVQCALSEVRHELLFTYYVSCAILNYYGLMMLAKDKLGSMKNVARVLFE
jgi:hypothetical protein